MRKVNRRSSGWLLRLVEVGFNQQQTFQHNVHNRDCADKTGRQKTSCEEKNNDDNLCSSGRDGSNPSEIKSSDTNILKLIHPSNTITKKFSEFSQLLGARFKTDTRNSCSMTRKRGGKQNHISFCVCTVKRDSIGHAGGRNSSGFVSLVGLVGNMGVADKDGVERSLPPGCTQHFLKLAWKHTQTKHTHGQTAHSCWEFSST